MTGDSIAAIVTAIATAVASIVVAAISAQRRDSKKEPITVEDKATYADERDTGDALKTARTALDLAERAEARADAAEKRAQAAEARAAVRDSELERRVSCLERALDAARETEAAFLDYVDYLLALIREHAPGIHVDPPPASATTRRQGRTIEP